MTESVDTLWRSWETIRWGWHMENFAVTAGAGTLRGPGVAFDHRWTDGGVSLDCEFTGAHLLHAAVAACVLNDLYREAGRIPLSGVRVTVRGGFDTERWNSTGITYAVEVDSPAAADEVARLVQRVERVAEIPRSLRAGMTVSRSRPDTAGSP